MSLKRGAPRECFPILLILPGGVLIYPAGRSWQRPQPVLIRGMNMTTFSFHSTFSATPRFRVLVNGFADRAPFPTLHDAVISIPMNNVESLSFEIYDALERRYVWTQPRESDSRACPAPFSIWVNGYPTGVSFASLTEAIVFISVRAPGEDCAVFENDACVFMLNSPRELKPQAAL